MPLELYTEVRAGVLALLRIVAKPRTRISGFGVRGAAVKCNNRSDQHRQWCASHDLSQARDGRSWPCRPEFATRCTRLDTYPSTTALASVRPSRRRCTAPPPGLTCLARCRRVVGGRLGTRPRPSGGRDGRERRRPGRPSRRSWSASTPGSSQATDLARAPSAAPSSAGWSSPVASPVGTADCSPW
jgi:hypothetical protein